MTEGVSEGCNASDPEASHDARPDKEQRTDDSEAKSFVGEKAYSIQL